MAKFGLTAPGEVRVAPLMALPSVLEALGVSPCLAFRRAGVEFDRFDHPENRIDHESLGRLLSVCSILSNRSDFGLMIATRFALRDFGILGELMRHSTTVGEALRVLMLHLNIHDRLAFPLLLRMDSANVFLGYSVLHPEKAGTPQIYDAAISIAFKMMRELCGPDWEPRFVQFSHREPENRTSYRRVFGPRLLFDAEWSGISFSETWLDQVMPDADPVRYGQLSQDLLVAQAVNPPGFRDEVQCVLHRLLLNGTTGAASIARLFGISERTLRHRLRLEGSSMHELLAETRFDLSRHLLQSTRLPMSKIAASLCYSDAAVFSRAFRGWAGVGPREWRALQAA